MTLRILKTNKEIELNSELNKLSTEIYKTDSISKVNKARVFRGTKKHFTKISEQDSERDSEKKELYYELEQGERFLEDYKYEEDSHKGKQYILDGLLELLFLVSEGKIYDIELNPFNFIINESGKVPTVKAFYRKDRSLTEVTDEWMYDVKKLIGYFLVTDRNFNEDNYKDLKPNDFYKAMESEIGSQYLQIMRSSTVDQMVQDWFSEHVYRQLKGFPAMVKDFNKPKDLTSLNKSLNLEDEPLTEYKREEINKKKEPEVVVEEIKYEEPKEPKKDTPKRVSRGKSSLITMPVIGSVILGLIVGILVAKIMPTKAVDIEEEVGEENVVVSAEYYDGLIKSSIQKYEEASEIYKNLKEEELNALGEDEQVSIYLTYLKVGEYDEAIKVHPDGVETMIKYLYNREKIEEILDVETDHPSINFEKAVLDQDYKTILELKEDVKDNEMRSTMILKAYVYEEDLDGAIEYVKEKNSKTYKDRLKETYENYVNEKGIKKKEKESNIRKINGI